MAPTKRGRRFGCGCVICISFSGIGLGLCFFRILGLVSMLPLGASEGRSNQVQIASCLQEGRDRRMWITNERLQWQEQVGDTEGYEEVNGIPGKIGQVHKDNGEREGENERSLGKAKERTNGADRS